MALEKHPREVHSPATRATRASRTDNIDTIIYRCERQLSSIELAAIVRLDDVGKGNFDAGKGRFDVGSGGSGHVKLGVREIETHEIKKGCFTLADHGTKMHEIKKNGSLTLADNARVGCS